MTFLERLGFKKKEKPINPEEMKEKQIAEKVKQILSLEKRIELIRKNQARGGFSDPGIGRLISDLERQIKESNEEIEALGGKPIGPTAEELEAEKMFGSQK